MLNNYELNPLNTAEGGAPHSSKYGRGMANARYYGPITVLPYTHDFAGRVGDVPKPATARPSIPYINDSWKGPIFLGPQDATLNLA